MTRARSARRVAVEALVRIDQGAYANLLLASVLGRSGLSARDRALVTELVYGVTRMRRACDWLVDRFVLRPLDPGVRAALRVGAYQLQFMAMPAHAAVSTAVAAAPPRTGSLVNAVLRRVADGGSPEWPDEGTRLSYPDWVLDRLDADLGRQTSRAALEAMNRPAAVTRRGDGYVQDRASQWVAEAVGVQPGDRVADLCAGPGGKATFMAEAGARVVVAGDVRLARVRLVAANAAGLGLANVAVVAADGRVPPIAPRSVDRVLVDAPCSGLGVLQRRPDARWRIGPDDVDRLATLQVELVDAAAGLLRPGGTLAYSVCTLTAAETLAVDDRVSGRHPELDALVPPGAPWEQAGRGARLLPQTAGTDGMFLLLLRRR